MPGMKALFGLSIIIFGLAFTGCANADSGGFIKVDVKTGTGKEAVSGKMVSVHYTGWLFDKSADDNKGKKFVLKIIPFSTKKMHNNTFPKTT